MSNLAVLSLSFCELTGSLPSEWSALSSLQHAYFAENSLNSTLPASWGNLRNLLTMYRPLSSSLILSYSMFSDPDLDTWVIMTSREICRLNGARCRVYCQCRSKDFETATCTIHDLFSFCLVFWETTISLEVCQPSGPKWGI